MLGKFTGEDQANGSLNLAGRDGGLLVVCSELGGLSSDTLEDIYSNQNWSFGDIESRKKKTNH